MQDTAGEAETSSYVMYSNGPPHLAERNQDDQLEHTCSSSVRIGDVALMTCQKRWTIGGSDERGPGISMLAARHDDDGYMYCYLTLIILFNTIYLQRVKRLQVLICINNNSINHQSFIYTKLSGPRVLVLTIQFKISCFFACSLKVIRFYW